MYEYQPKSYEEMMAIAKQISPDAKVRISEFTDTWEIYIATEFNPSHELPAEYEGTPAWTAHKTPDSHGDVLTRWANKNSFNHLPIEGVADYYNLREEDAKALVRIWSTMLDEDGTRVEDPMNVTEEQRDAYRATSARAKKAHAEEMAPQYEELAKKWDF